MTLKALGETARFINGAAFKPTDWEDEGLPIIRIQNLTGTGEKFNLTTRQVKPELIVEPGDLLVSWSATLDVYRWAGPRGVLNQHIFKVLPNAEIDPDYLFYALKNALAELSAKTHGSTMKHVVRGDFESTRVRMPPHAEQRRIVDILSRAEGIVRLRREAEKKAAELIPALFLDMFGDPTTNPKGWSVVRLGDCLAEPPILGTMAKPSSVAGRWLDLRVANIQGGQLTLSDKKWIDLPSAQIERFALRAGDIVLARAIGSLDHLGKAVVVAPDGEWTFDSHLMRVRLDITRLLPVVFKSFLESSGGREEFLKHTRRSAVQFNINGKELREIRIPLPPLNLQHEYLGRAEVVNSIQSQQSAASAKAQATFDALLAQVFSNNQER